MQSEPVSPPPITTTCLPGREDRLGAILRFVADAPVLLRQEFHGEVNALEVAARRWQVAAFLGAARQHHGIVAGEEIARRQCHADMGAAMEAHALRLHLGDAPVDVMLLHLEVGDAVAQQAAGLGVVSRRRERRGRRGRAAGRRQDRPVPSRRRRPTCRSLRAGGSGLTQPSSKARSTMAHSMVLMVTGLSSMLSVHDASHGAGQTRPVNSGKLLVECRLRAASCQAPV